MKRRRRPPTGLWRTVPLRHSPGAPSPEGTDGDCDTPEESGSAWAVPSGMKADSPRQTHTPPPAGSQLLLGHGVGSVNTSSKRNCCLPSSLAAQGNPTKGGIRVSWVITRASAGSEATPPPAPTLSSGCQLGSICPPGGGEAASPVSCSGQFQCRSLTITTKATLAPDRWHLLVRAGAGAVHREAKMRFSVKTRICKRQREGIWRTHWAECTL